MTAILESPHYTYQQLSDGVYAALARPGGGGSSNCAIVDLGEQTLLLDTGETPAAGRDLRAACIALTGRAPLYVVISHAHLDHWLGNQAFADAAIISTRPTRDWLPAMAREMEAVRKDPAAILQKIQQTEQALATETDPAARAALENALSKSRFQLEALAEQQFIFPNLLFEGCMRFEGARRTVELIATNGAHTPGDCYLSLADECTVLVADLCFFDVQPYIFDGNIAPWLEQLDALSETCNAVFVPGHGPVGNQSHLARQIEYMRLLQSWAVNAVQEGQPVEALFSRALPATFADWYYNQKVFERNLQNLYEYALREDRA